MEEGGDREGGVGGGFEPNPAGAGEAEADAPLFAPRWPAALRHPLVFDAFDRMRDFVRDRVERGRFARRTLPDTARRVLVIRDRGLGDVLQVTTILERIRARYGAERLDIITSPRGREVLRADPRVDEVLLTRDPPPDLAERYDLFLNLHLFDNSPDARAVVEALPERRLVGRTFRPGRDEAWYEHLAGGSWLRKYCRIADVSFDPELPLHIRLYRDAEWAEEAAAMRARLNARGATPVVVCLGGMTWERNYSVPFLFELVARLKRDRPVALVGLRADRTAEEREELDRLLAAHPDVLDFLDDPLREMLLEIEGGGALVTCDTGPLHMALALGTPLVALFGHTTGRQLLGPRRRSARHVALTPESGCRACGYRHRPECAQARRARCMDRFDPETVARWVDTLFRPPEAREAEANAPQAHGSKR